MIRTGPGRADYSGITPKEAVTLQNELRSKVVAEARLGDVSTVAGIDVSIRAGKAIAAVAVFTFPALDLVETRTAVRPVEFPYIPGLLAFREAPVIYDAFEKLEQPPSFLLVDGQGMAHPRRFGLACHLGVELGLPSIGCGKTRLTGHHDEPPAAKGSWVELVDEGEIIGRVLRTRENVKPVYISVGHMVDLDMASDLTLRSVTRYRLPEPIRAAHKAAGEK